MNLHCSDIKCLHVIVAALGYFALGAVWYSAIFGKMWMKANKIDPQNVDRSGFMKIMIINLVMTIVISYGITMLQLIIGIGSLMPAVKLGVGCGLFFYIIPSYINTLYEKRPFSLVLINGGYVTGGMVIASVIMAVWK